MQGLIDFVSQGGYAFYVWSAFGMTFGLLLVELLQVRNNRRSTLTRLARLARLRTPTQSRRSSNETQGGNSGS